MDDMTAFEQQLAGELGQMAGPGRRIDGMAMVRTVSTQSPKRRFGSMFSATKFVVAGAIVALFGGFLLSGVLMQRSDEVSAPAAVSASPSTGPDLLPGVDLVTEEVEPGIERIVSDGIRDLSGVGQGRYFGHAAPDGLAVTPDGAVWLDTGGLVEPGGLVKLGNADPFPMAQNLKVSPDGDLWSRGPSGPIRRLDGEGWSDVASAGQFDAWDLDADGTVWSGGRGASVTRLDASGRQEYPIDLDSIGLDIRQMLEDHADEAGEAPGVLLPTIHRLWVDATGDVWVALAISDYGTVPMVVLRYDGETWSLVDPLGVGKYYNVGPLDVGPDGTMWVYLETGISESERQYLARLADDHWTVFSEEDGVVQLTERGDYWGLLRVDHDGAAWVQPQDGSRSVRVFDGRTWRQYLAGHDVIDMETAPDGKVWVLTSDHLYRITPEAVAATE